MARRTLGAVALTVCALLASTATAQITFTPDVYATGNLSIDVTSGDFNRDGKPDLAVLNIGAERLTILLNVGGGKFAFGHDYPAGDLPMQVITADFQRDGKLDLVVANRPYAEVTFFRGNGDGTFTVGQTISLGQTLSTIATNDVSGDHIADVVTGGSRDAGLLELLINNGSGNFFRKTYTLPASSVASHGVVIADLNADGRNDVALAADKKLLVYKGTWAHPELQLLSSTSVPESKAVTALAIGSLNAGSTLDAVLRLSRSCQTPCEPDHYAYVYLNDGTGRFTFKSQLFIGKNIAGPVGISDLNGDRKMDLLIVRQGNDDSRILYALGNGDGTFKTPVLIATESPTGFWLRDLNLDSRHDFAIADWRDGTYVFLNNNAATNCAPPASDTVRVRVCFAGRSGTLRDTIGVRASGNAPAGVKRMELWIDGKKRFQAYDDQMHTRVSGLRSGSHRIVVQTIDVFGAVAKKTHYTTLP